ncbi:MAG: prolyl oligopeptidase family serine peptidase [Lentisphaeria bacterium]|nr:prolyl oligopeptidase family serine peptidase [Lentisphaeria bacterium]
MLDALAAILIEGVDPVTTPGFPEGVQRIEYRSAADGHRDWALCLPPASGGLWVVKIHGHGSHGDQLFTRPDIRQSWLPLFTKHGLGILSPNLRDNAWMSPAAARDLQGLLAHVRQRCKAQRFILASGSMGGTSNLIYAVLHPEDVAGVVALCPATDLTTYHAWCRHRNEGTLKAIADAIETAYGGPPGTAGPQAESYTSHSAVQNVARLTMPTYIVHGTRDPLIPVSQPRRLMAAVGKAAHVVYVEIPDGHHDAPLSLMRPALEWILQKMATE